MDKPLLLLDEMSKGGPFSQRDLSKKLYIAPGLVNSYLKNLVAKGYVTIKAIPGRRYAFCLTPECFGEKSRLTYQVTATRCASDTSLEMYISTGQEREGGVRPA